MYNRDMAIHQPYSKKNVYSKGVVVDGYKFRSDSEYQFYRKFLKEENVAFEYEKPYPFEGKRKCDFYIEALDLWVELCMYDPYSFPLTKVYALDSKPKQIILNVPYRQRRVAKLAGAKWDPKLKKWCILKSTLRYADRDLGGKFDINPWISADQRGLKWDAPAKERHKRYLSNIYSKLHEASKPATQCNIVLIYNNMVDNSMAYRTLIDLINAGNIKTNLLKNKIFSLLPS